MDCPNPEVYVDMMRRFSTTLNKVLLAYADMVQKDFPRFVHSEKLACILMNNVQQLRYAQSLLGLHWGMHRNSDFPIPKFLVKI